MSYYFGPYDNVCAAHVACLLDHTLCLVKYRCDAVTDDLLCLFSEATSKGMI